MSFALTTSQVLDGSKDVTRRAGWQFLKVGDLLRPVRKCMGLRPGEKLEVLRAPILVIDVRREPLRRMIAGFVAPPDDFARQTPVSTSMSTFYIASLKHTRKDQEHVTFWSRFHRGYTPVVDGPNGGLYCFGEAVALNDGLDRIAIRVEVVVGLLAPEPYFRTNTGEAAQFYDQRGRVILNTRPMWSALIAGSLVPGRHVRKIKPEVFRGKPRSFALGEPEQEAEAERA